MKLISKIKLLPSQEQANSLLKTIEAANEACNYISQRAWHGKLFGRSPLLHSWAFADLQQKILYKAQRVGVPVIFVNPAYTSQACSQCGHIDKSNRQSQSVFCCTSCGFAAHADVNAAQNIRILGRGSVNTPNADSE